MSKKIVVIGGGAAGMMAAISAAEKGAAVTLLEPNERHTQRFKKRHRVLTAEAGKYAVQKPTVAGNIGHQLVH